ncbi:uncharacterized protein LOC126738957 isoform X4 [Anthonomus grandis grandis]|uniref:uncharacterized protein LOC126738957 isoform X4 n=1 Tax=Anthonomus grandis grandis TaxID=2921223 RepID=UPI0021651535|nr:uncharacterized protein LOC126738957 isoform X4 [Anthonomus grandis grandis]XP_050300446.1 uncharacterized protein LOC126738957 isoform X4 [Anthonomus grandis grandis]XP_050300455.1 uncharacterized protein LOC126738957 isoform X4 [Anthonomus grandis grandis]
MSANQSFSESLISLVYKSRPIWDPKHRDNKDRNILQLNWQEIGKKLDTHPDVAKQKWKNLKDYYRSELKRTKRCEDNDTAPRVTSWPHFDQMSFLQDTIKFKQQTPNDPLTLTNDQINEDFKIEFDSDETEREEEACIEKCYQDLHPVQQESMMNFNDDSSSSTRKQTGCFNIPERCDEEVECKRIKLIFEKEEDFDEDLMFFKSLLPDFRFLPRTRKMALKVKFQQLLYEETLSAVGQTT